MSTSQQRAPHCSRWWFGTWDRLVNGALGICGEPKIVVPNGRLAVDFHLHTSFSHCSTSRPDDILLRASALGLTAIAVMDHHYVEGALETVRRAEELKRLRMLPESFLVVPGVELNSTIGHVGALFVTEDLPEKLRPEKIVRAIHEAGGLAVAVHPYHSSGIGDAVFDAPFDAVEIECGSVFDPRLAQRNRTLALDPRLAQAAKIGGSDAHYLKAVGSCYTVVDTESVSIEGLRAAILSGKCSAHSTDFAGRLQKILGLVPKLR
ncbi:MAG: PHP domain-containing protein [Armatimonadota bacterium]|nr:PHP domain-containing protein [Armatimonadota bacterium]